MMMSTIDSSIFDELNFVSPLDGPLQPYDKKKGSKSIDQKGRHKINSQIDELKFLLPECRYVSTTKASVLDCAVNSLKKLQAARAQLAAANQKLLSENNLLKQELQGSDKEDGESNFPIESLDPFSTSNTFAQASSHNSHGSMSTPPSGNASNVMSLTSNSVNPPIHMEPLNSHLQYKQSRPKRTKSAHRGGDSDSDEDYKVSKRKILMLILLIVPLFLSFEPTVKTNSMTMNPSGSSRILLDTTPKSWSTNFMATLCLLTLLDVTRFVVYFVLGIVGIKWTASSFLWMLNSEPSKIALYYKYKV